MVLEASYGGPESMYGLPGPPRPPKKKEEPPRDNSCSVCERPDYRVCACPWEKPFELWGRSITIYLKAIVGPDSGPRGWKP